MLGLGLTHLSLPVMSATPTQRAIAILRKFGTNAHVYLPGIGALNGLTAGNYLDSAGTTAATVDNPVGLMLDCAGSLGVELVTNGNFTSWSGDNPVGWTLTAVETASEYVTQAAQGARIVSSGPFIAITQNSIAAGYYYEVTLVVSSVAAGGVSIYDSGTFTSQSFTSPGTYKFKLLSTGATVGIKRSSAVATDVTVGSFSVRAVTGIHASQATTANKPILRQTSGKYSLQFDGVNDSLSLGSVPFQMADDFAIVAAGNCATGIPGAQTFYSSASNASATPFISLDVSGGVPRFVLRDDAGTLEAPTGPTGVAGVTSVLTGSKVGNRKVLRVNGVQATTPSTVTQGVTTLTGSAVGCRPVVTPNNFLQGNIGPVIAIKGTVTDAELLLLERFVASLTPNAPSF